MEWCGCLWGKGRSGREGKREGNKIEGIKVEGIEVEVRYKPARYHGSLIRSEIRSTLEITIR